ncbi:MAG TPA: hypothetical protein VJB08_06690 [Candidatus Nanoarchaeia archaeon]|nr:hypothetical protein [Candidatus Nanoarchaeia archaeon]
MKHYLSHLRQKKPIDVKKSFVEIQTELDRISPLSSIIGDIETSLGKENKDLRHLKMKVLLSEMKGKEEIRNRLCLLTHHLGLLRKSLLINDRDKLLGSIAMFTKNPYARLSGVIQDVASLEKLIKEFDHNYETYVRQNATSLDHRLHLEKGYGEAMEQLQACLQGKKVVAASLGRMFVDLGRSLIRKDNDLENQHTRRHLP